MHNINEIRAWALQVLQAAENHQPDEDSRVELKTRWPDNHYQTARQLAGHCNAARGDDVLWLIGIDQKSGTITGADRAELSNWFPQIRSFFDGIAPEPLDVNIPARDGRTVVALLFETSDRPYVVRNPLYNTPNGGPISLEVPWRATTSTRSAMQADLLKIMLPLQKTPIVKLKEATFQPRLSRTLTNTGWDLIAGIYVIPQGNTPVVIPKDECEAHVEFVGIVPSTKLDGAIEFRQEGRNSTSTQMVFDAPGMARILGSNNGFPGVTLKADAIVNLALRLTPIGADRPIIIRASLTPNTAQCIWRFPQEKA